MPLKRAAWTGTPNVYRLSQREIWTWNKRLHTRCRHFINLFYVFRPGGFRSGLVCSGSRSGAERAAHGLFSFSSSDASPVIKEKSAKQLLRRKRQDRPPKAGHPDEPMRVRREAAPLLRRGLNRRLKTLRVQNVSDLKSVQFLCFYTQVLPSDGGFRGCPN